jgi:hypothetical protein
MKAIITTLTHSNTFLGLFRQGLIAAGAFFVAKGWISDGINLWLFASGAVVTLGAAVWDSLDEYWRVGDSSEPDKTTNSKHALLALIQSILTAVGTFLVAGGHGTESVILPVIAGIMAILSAIWGVSDEANTEVKEKKL